MWIDMRPYWPPAGDPAAEPVELAFRSWISRDPFGGSSVRRILRRLTFGDSIGPAFAVAIALVVAGGALVNWPGRL